MVQNDKIKQLHQIISALEQFQRKKSSLFSLSKLANYFNLSERDLEEVLELVFRFQALFSSILEDYILVKKWKNQNTYLTLKPKGEVKYINLMEPKEIEIDNDQVKVLIDVVYYFQHVKIGKGFNIKSSGTQLCKKVKQFNRSHPYFFERKGNGLLYPSKLAVEAGNLISSYHKNKKTISRLEIEDYLIQIV